MQSAGATVSRNGKSHHAKGTALRRVLAGSVVGTALEWYDFFIYGTAAALVFGDLFFNDKAGTGVGTLAAFATFGVGFVVRPLGGILFGNMGDRIGRRETLIVTTLLMGVSTGIIGLLPTYASIGLWAPILLTLMRVCQGLGAGAEFGGASTLLAEHAPKERRGFYGSFSQLGVQLGLVLGTSVVPARQPAARGPADVVGLADPVPALVPDDLRDAVLPHAGGGVAGLQRPARAQAGREDADPRHRQALPEERARRHRRARRRRGGDLHLHRVQRLLRHRRARAGEQHGAAGRRDRGADRDACSSRSTARCRTASAGAR